MSTTQHVTTQHPVDYKGAKEDVKKEIQAMHDPDQPIRAKEEGHKFHPTTHYGVDHPHGLHSGQPASVHPAVHNHGVGQVPPAAGTATHGVYPTTAPGVGGINPVVAPGGPTYGVNQPTTHFGGGHQDPVHHPKAAEAELKKEINYAQAKDQDEPMGERVKAAAKVPVEKVKEVAHKATPGKHHGVDHTHPEGSHVHPVTTAPGVVTNATGYPSAAVHGPTTPGYPATAHGPTAAVGPHGVLPGGPTANIQDPAHHPKAVQAEAKKEMHEYQAQDPDQSAGTRAKAAVKIPGDKAKEVAHKAKPEKHDPAVHPPVVAAGYAHADSGHPIGGVVGDPTTYAVHPHSGVNHPSGVGAHPVQGAKVEHKHQPATHIGSEPVGSTTYAGHSTHPPATKTPPSTPVSGTKQMEESIKVKEAEVKKEAHKEVAADSDNKLTERVKAAVKVPVDAAQVAIHERKEKRAEKKEDK